MISDEELLIVIEDSIKDYRGQIDHFYQAVGIIIVGRFMGWRVMRLVSPNRCWSKSTEIFGDPKLLMNERGKYAYKSVGLKIVDKFGDYWGFIRGSKDRDSLTLKDRKLVE